MNFDFLKGCKLENSELQGMYEVIAAELEKAEWRYFRNPQECGIILRGTAEKICRIYNTYFEVGYPKEASLEEFLCYTDNEQHNVLVSRFLSVIRKEQRDRLNKLRVLGDDCVWGEEAPDQGMSFEDRMSQNAKRMMETMMEALKEMCTKINKLDGIREKAFREESLPEQREQIMAEIEREKEAREQEKRKEKKTWFSRIFASRD